MSSSIDRTSLAGIVVALVVGVGWATVGLAQPGQAALPGAEWRTREVDAAVLEAADKGSMRDLMKALARSRVPASFVLSADDVWEGIMGRSLPGRHATGAPVVLGAVLDRILERQPGRRVTAQDGVISFQPSRLPACAGLLRRRIDVLDAEGEAFAVVYQVVRAANRDRTPFLPPSLMGHGVSSIDEPDEPVEDDGEFYRSRVALHLRGVSTREALDQLVLQVPGLGWALVERPEIVTGPDGRGHRDPENRKLPCTVELFARNGMTSGSNVLRDQQ